MAQLSSTNIFGNLSVTGNIVSNSGGATFNQTPANIFIIQATGAPTTDMVQITNANQNTTTTGVNALQINYLAGSTTAANENSAIRTEITPVASIYTGSVVNAIRIIASTAIPTSGAVGNGIKWDTKSTGSGTSNAMWIGTGWDNILNYNGTTVINGTGNVIAGQLSGTIPSAVLGNSTVYIGTTGVALNRASATLSLASIKLGSLTTNGPMYTSGGDGTLNSETYLSVARGGTGVGTFTANGVLYGNGTSAIQVTAAGASGQILAANSSGVPTWTSSALRATSISIIAEDASSASWYPTFVSSTTTGSYQNYVSTKLNYVPSTGVLTAGYLKTTRGSANWNESIPGTAAGSIHLIPGSTDHYGNAITFGASDTGSGLTAQAGIYARTDGAYGTKMYIATTDSYSNGSTTRIMINHNGDVGIGSVSPSYRLEVSGTARAGKFLASFHSGTDGGYSFSSDTDSGMFSNSDGSVVLKSNGTAKLAISPTVLEVPRYIDFHNSGDVADSIDGSFRLESSTTELLSFQTGTGSSFTQRAYINTYGLFGAVGNDYADVYKTDILEKDIQFRRVYVIDEKGKPRLSKKYNEKGVIGIATNEQTFTAVKEGEKGIPISVGGFVSAVLDKKYPPGTPLVCGPEGKLTRARWYTRIFSSHAILGFTLPDGRVRIV